MDSEGAPLNQLEEHIGYTFTDISLLERSLTHPSYYHNNPSSEAVSHNQRLEFLGDAILGLIIAEHLFDELPEQREGNLTRFRSVLVKGNQLSELAAEIHLGAYLRLGEAEVINGGRQRPSILEDAFEALVGAIYLDGGYAAAKATILQIYGDVRERLDRVLESHNPKGRLQEILQPSLGNAAIEYRIVRESGPDHEKQFEVEVCVEGIPRGNGGGASKKEAEENAARDAIQWWDTTNQEPHAKESAS